jgi:hypothetical protein
MPDTGGGPDGFLRAAFETRVRTAPLRFSLRDPMIVSFFFLHRSYPTMVYYIRCDQRKTWKARGMQPEADGGIPIETPEHLSNLAPLNGTIKFRHGVVGNADAFLSMRPRWITPFVSRWHCAFVKTSRAADKKDVVAKIRR